MFLGAWTTISAGILLVNLLKAHIDILFRKNDNNNTSHVKGSF
jgi:hypothetical protein